MIFQLLIKINNTFKNLFLSEEYGSSLSDFAGGGFFLLNVLHIYLFSAVLHGAPSAVKEKTKMSPIFTNVMIVPFLTLRLFQGHYIKKYCTYQVPFYLCVG